MEHIGDLHCARLVAGLVLEVFIRLYIGVVGICLRAL
jgi:hypothetical protein